MVGKSFIKNDVLNMYDMIIMQKLRDDDHKSESYMIVIAHETSKCLHHSHAYTCFNGKLQVIYVPVDSTENGNYFITSIIRFNGLENGFDDVKKAHAAPCRTGVRISPGPL